MTEVSKNTPVDKKELAKKNRIAALARARAAKKLKASPLTEVKEESTVAEIMAKKTDNSAINFFTEIDLDKNGNPKASYPFYQNPRQLEEIKEDKRKLEQAVAKGFVDTDHLPEIQGRINQYSKQLEALEKHNPDMTKNIDRIDKTSKALAEVISPLMFTRKEMREGLVDPHEEARRMVEPCVELPKEVCETAIKNGVPVGSDRKVSRDNAVRLWQMCNRTLGKSTDAEYLRRD
jgi:hypothetical protein